MVFTLKELEKKEIKYLEKYAVKSANSLGRKFKEKHDDARLCFQRDKDRIVHCKAFRRLNEKTQVFIAGSGDHYRTRLTHTLEVSHISRDVARRLGLNEDLCEAIALAHDLGHPPFGHGGEEALDEIMKDFGMNFEHNDQSRRIVEELEDAYPDFHGLNLTFEVLDGLLKHKTSWDRANRQIVVFPHLEAQIVNIADEIAYTNHDMDDGLRSGLIKLKDLEKFELWKIGEKMVYKKYGKNLDRQIMISRVISAIISIMIDDFCKETDKNIQKNKKLLASFSDEMNKMVSALRKFLYDNFYMNPQISKFIVKGKAMIKRLFEFYFKNPEKFPKNSENLKGNELVISIKDYIAGMTDGFLTEEYDKLGL
jgi:dGTPase